MPIDIVVDGFAAKKAEGKCWSSAPFYTHLQGYKMYLSIYCNGNKAGEGTHVSIYIFLTSGEHDDELQWPFHNTITVLLVDQENETDHYDYVLRFDHAPDHCTRRVGKLDFDHGGWGTPKFIGHSKLSPKYLVNDKLVFVG